LGASIVITVSEHTPPADHPGALAYAMPYERTHIVVFYDRLLDNVPPSAMPALLGHVLAHEIAHILQGTDHHSASGVMQAKWTHGDYVDMQRRPLRFTEEDLMLIRQGIQNRASRRAASAKSLK
jgi:hypothetical protein